MIATAHDILTNLWSTWGLFIAAFVIAFLVLLGLGLCRAASLGDLGSLNFDENDLMLSPLDRHLDANRAGYERLLDAVDDPFLTTRLEIAALPETRTR